MNTEATGGRFAALSTAGLHGLIHRARRETMMHALAMGAWEGPLEARPDSFTVVQEELARNVERLTLWSTLLVGAYSELLRRQEALPSMGPTPDEELQAYVAYLKWLASAHLYDEDEAFDPYIHTVDTREGVRLVYAHYRTDAGILIGHLSVSRPPDGEVAQTELAHIVMGFFGGWTGVQTEGGHVVDHVQHFRKVLVFGTVA